MHSGSISLDGFLCLSRTKLLRIDVRHIDESSDSGVLEPKFEQLHQYVKG